MNLISKSFLGLFLLWGMACQRPESSPGQEPTQKAGWQLVYQHDAQGKAIRGSLDALIEGIRQGLDVRIGWGWERELGDSLVRLEHMASPVFLSIIQEEDVSAVIDPHPLLESYLDIEQQAFAKDGNLWQCVLSTQGTFNAQVYKRGSTKLLKNWPQRHKLTWFLEYPPQALPPSKPLY